jgi:ankyrin repeat protein
MPSVHAIFKGFMRQILRSSLVLFSSATKAGVNAKSKDAFTPLHLAARGNYKDIVELLLAHRAKVTDDDKVTPLYLAAMQRDLVKVKELLKSNAVLVYSEDTGVGTLLHWAAKYDGHGGIAAD